MLIRFFTPFFCDKRKAIPVESSLAVRKASSTCECLTPDAKANYSGVMEVQLTPGQKEFIRQAIATGRILREEDAVREALAMWEERERERMDILVMIEEAEASLDRGEGIELTEESLKAFTDDITARGCVRFEAARSIESR